MNFLRLAVLTLTTTIDHEDRWNLEIDGVRVWAKPVNTADKSRALLLGAELDFKSPIVINNVGLVKSRLTSCLLHSALLISSVTLWPSACVAAVLLVLPIRTRLLLTYRMLTELH
jgi:hypothetical protein